MLARLFCSVFLSVFECAVKQGYFWGHHIKNQETSGHPTLQLTSNNQKYPSNCLAMLRRCESMHYKCTINVSNSSTILFYWQWESIRPRISTVHHIRAIWSQTFASQEGDDFDWICRILAYYIWTAKMFNLFSSLQSPDLENAYKAKDSTPAVAMEMTSDVSTASPLVTDPEWEAELKPLENEPSASQQPRSFQMSTRQASLPDSSPGGGLTPGLHRPSSDPGLPGQ